MKRLLLALFVSLVAAATSSSQTSTDARLEEARKKLAAGDAEAAMTAVEAVVAKYPDLPPSQLVFAGLLFQNRNMAAGRAVMERAAVERPDHPEVFSSFGRLALAEGRLVDASLCFERAVVLAASDKWPAAQKRQWLNSAHAGVAAVAERRKEWKSAFASLMALVEMNPGDSVTRWRLGRASFYVDKAQQAEELFRSAFKENPRLDPPEVTLAELWSQKGDAAKAESTLTRALAENPDEPRLRTAMTRFLIHAGRGEAARQSASRGLAMHPKNPDARLLAALAARQVGDVSAAEAIIYPWLAEAPDNAVVLSQAAQLEALSKEPEKRAKALAHARAIGKDAQGRPDSQTTLGIVQFLLGDTAEAEKTFRSVLLSGGANADTAFYLGMILEQKGDREGAVRQFNRALEAPGLFLFRTEAQSRRDKLNKAEPSPQTKS